MIHWNPSLDALPFSPIRHMFNAAAEMSDVLHLSIGQPDFTAPAHVAQAMIDSVRGGQLSYALDAGLPELREVIASFYAGRDGVALTPDNVLITTGCCQAMYLALRSAVHPGAEVIITEPAFVLKHIIELAGGVPRVIVTTARNGYQVDPEEVVAAMGPNTCAVMLNSPGNPTGTLYPPAVMRRICTAAIERGLAIISDEVYDRLILGPGEFASALAVSPGLENVIVTSSLPKTYAVPGLRVGWAISSAQNITALQRYHMFISTCENTPSQWAGVAAFSGDQGCVQEMVDEYRSRRDRLIQLVDACPQLTGYVPEGAFFMMPSLPTGADSVDVAMRLLQETGVCTIPGGAFGPSCNNALRISYSTSIETIERAFDRMVPWLQKQSF